MKVTSPSDEDEPFEIGDEQLEVLRRRYQEARRAGLTVVEARLFSESAANVGELRKLVEAGCPVERIREIVL